MKKHVREFFAKSGDYLKDFSLVPKVDNSDIAGKELVKDFDKEFFEKVLDKFNSRRSCRKFSSKPISDKLVYNIIDASLKAPCAGSLQNIYVIVISDKHKMGELSQIHSMQTWMSEAPMMLAIVSDSSKIKQLYPQDWENLTRYNASTVTSSILYLSQIAGLGTCWVKAGDNDKTCSVLGCSGKYVDALVPIGYSIDNPNYRDYLPTTERLFFNSFGNRDRKNHH